MLDTIDGAVPLRKLLEAETVQPPKVALGHGAGRMAIYCCRP
jgi:hypothetical protein